MIGVTTARSWSKAGRLALLVCLFLLATRGFAATVSGTVTATGSGYYPDASVMYVKLVSGSTVLQVVQPDLISGTYTFNGVSVGSYSVVVSNNNSTADTTPSTTVLYVFDSPSSGLQSVNVSSAASSITGVNFALLYHCSCGYGDGRLTLQSIPMSTNGDLSAWSSVVADSDNNACDSTSPDRDAPIQSTGRDLLQFTYTYDGSSLYGFTTRVASDSNTDNFIYYADINNNGIMENNEPVIYVAWQGNNRTVIVGIGQYRPANPSGDPINSPTTGYADGYHMPGSIANGRTLRSGSWGSTSGLAMQWYVTWSELGITPGTVIRWHVSSTNSTPTAASLPNQIDDNLGGCGGCAASNQYAGVKVTGTSTVTTGLNSTIYLPHIITNTGNGTDTFTFKTSISGPWTPISVAYYADNNANGTYDPGTDTLIADSGPLAAGASKNILVAITTPSAPVGQDTITFRATSSYIGGCGTAPSTYATATDLVTATNATISGAVYFDANHNGTLDSGETWTGPTVYINLVQGTSVVQSVQIASGGGTYILTPSSNATYTIIVTNSATSTTATIPAGWLAVSPNSPTLAVTFSGITLTNQNFGLFAGSKVSGSAFIDNGAGGGTANDGKLNGTEKGLASVSIVATDGASTTYDSTITDANGAYTLWVPNTATTVVINETLSAGYIATGGDVGTSGGTYSRSATTITFTYSPTASYTGLRFGQVPVNTFFANNALSGVPGTSVLYPHTFTALTAGQVTFSTTAASSSPNWFTELVFRDTDCSGTLTGSDTPLTSAVTVSAGDKLCILVKEMIANNAGFDAENAITVTAQFTYTNASPALSASYTRTDTTTVSNASNSGLRLVKTVDKTTAKSGDTLLYTITYSNVSSGTVANIVVADSTPSYTTFVSAACGTLPTGITGCSVSTQPSSGGTGAIKWTLTGSLASSASGQVTFNVRIQ